MTTKFPDAQIQAANTNLLTYEAVKDFDAVVADFEKQLGYLDQAKALSDPNNIAEATRLMEGSAGLMIISVLEMDRILPDLSKTKIKSRQYLVGNPNIADSMAKYDILTTLMVPPRVLIYTDAGKTKIAYEQPSTTLGRLSESEIDKTARALDEKFERLAKNALS
ncbi:MAG TPA: DUF302 domain-containing protein [Drouetiella sp.]